MDLNFKKKSVLIVDDEETISHSLSLLLKNLFNVTTTNCGEQAIQLAKKSRYDIILLDLNLPGIDGIQALKEIRNFDSDVSIIMLTGSNSARFAVNAIKSGANDYLTKPFNIDEIIHLAEKLTNEKFSEITEKSGEKDRPTELIGSSPVMVELINKIKTFAPKDTTTLINGESGTGKELIAKEIHKLSSRSQQPFVAINCASIPETLIESELFGHERGAFTHAVEKRLGHFELADHGTLFLDEIGELSLATQVKLLRFLQEQEFYRLGNHKPIKVDVRIITATNKDLEQLIKENKFREDLYYRINVINLKVPPLRDRMSDLEPLIDYFQEKFREQYKRKLTFTKETWNVLNDYNWPGNVRELENLLEAMLALCPEDAVKPEHLPQRIFSNRKEEEDNLMVNFEEAEKIFETEIILKALKRANFVTTRAAEILGISRRILKYKMDKLGLAGNE